MGREREIICETVPSILSFSLDEFQKFNNTGARMQKSIYRMTLKSQLIRDFLIKMLENATLLWTSRSPLSQGLLFLMYDVITLSGDKKVSYTAPARAIQNRQSQPLRRNVVHATL